MDGKCSVWGFSIKIIWKRWFVNMKHKIVIPLSVFVRESYGVLVLAFLLMFDGTLAGRGFYELILFQSIMSLNYGILVMFFTGLRDFSPSRKKGIVDMALLKPKGVLMQILFRDTDWFAVVGHGVLGILLFVIGITHISVDMSLLTILLFSINLLGGVMIQAAIWLFLAGLRFYTNDVGPFEKVLFWIPRMWMRFPMDLFPNIIGHWFVYVVPFGFVSYFPVLMLLGKWNTAYPQWFGYLSMPLGIVLYIAAYGFFRMGLKRYRKVM